VDQGGAMRCGGAGGARNWRGGAAEMADGGGQRSSGKVVERRREQEYGCVRGDGRKEKFTGRVPKLKRGGRAGGKQLLRSTARVAPQAGSGATRLREEEPAGSVKRRAGELGPGGAGRAAKGQLAAEKTLVMGGGRRCRETERGKQEEEDEDLFVNFVKVQGVH
jgi:hypothetical protein